MFKENYMDNSQMSIAIPVHEIRTNYDMRECSRCHKMFVPAMNSKKCTAQYYRCNMCLSSNTILRDLVHSCTIS